MEKIKQNCGLSETKESEKKIKEFYKKNIFRNEKRSYNIIKK